MEDTLSSVDSSGFFVILAILLCIVTFYTYLRRLELPDTRNDTWQDPVPIPETRVHGTTLPCSVTFTDTITASMKDGIVISVKTSPPCILQSFWAVKCSGLTEILQACQRSPSDYTVMEQGLQEISVTYSEKQFLESGSSQEVHVRMNAGATAECSQGWGSEEEGVDLGPTPRTRYPLVLLFSRGDGEPVSGTQEVVIKSVMWIIHLPDKTVTLSSRVISRVLITSQGQVCDLQKVYLASDGFHPDSETCDRSADVSSLQASHQNPSTIPTNHSRNSREYQNMWTQLDEESIDRSKSCAVCQNAPISRVIIPCRHACVCEHCLLLLFACPMCRGAIQSHFRIKGEGVDGDETRGRSSGDGHLVEDEDWTMRMQNVMERFNEWFGF